ncbi:MAG TPA: hypothetical protein VHO91_03630, partial [Rhodopila sp.]|nr:hypothetical protein [Rhodopila sp.]
QPLTDMVSARAGVSRGASACFCIDMASLAWIVSRVPALSDAVTHWQGVTAFTDMVVLLAGLAALVSLRILFRKAGDQRQANPLRRAMRPHRVVVLLMLLARLAPVQAPGLPEVADALMLLFSGSALYLGACTERPPVRRGWRAWAATNPLS